MPPFRHAYYDALLLSYESPMRDHLACCAQNIFTGGHQQELQLQCNTLAPGMHCINDYAEK